MKTSHTTAVAILACLLASSVSAEIDGNNSLGIDFTNSAEAKAKATWSDPDRVTTSTKGLGWDGEAASSRDGRIQTIPLALGLSWRPPDVISVRVSIYPKPTEVVYDKDQSVARMAGFIVKKWNPKPSNPSEATTP